MCWGGSQPRHAVILRSPDASGRRRFWGWALPHRRAARSPQILRVAQNDNTAAQKSSQNPDATVPSLAAGIAWWKHSKPHGDFSNIAATSWASS